MKKPSSLLSGLELIHSGKVRDTYGGDEFNSSLLLHCSDRISIFDFVLGSLIPGKGQVLNALSYFWFDKLAEYGVPVRQHLLAAGADIDEYLPPYLRGNPDIQSRSIVARRLTMSKVEFVARGYLTGSGLTYYREFGNVYGHLPLRDLQDGDKLPCVIDTPTTKAEDGHDVPVDFQHIRREYAEETFLLLQIYQIIHQIALARGIVFADTKLEFGWDGNSNDAVTLGDEVGTPDSSRYWDYRKWLACQKSSARKAPPSLDKQLARDWGKTKEIHTWEQNAENAEKAARVELPQELIQGISQTYRYIFWRLTGKTLEAYNRDCLGVSLPLKEKKLAILLGSESDKSQVLPVIEEFQKVGSGQISFGSIHIGSCHRNPYEVMQFAERGCLGADVVIACGGKAFALPGIVDAFLYAAGKQIPVVGVALGKPGSDELLAAELSIKQLPGEYVVMDEMEGGVYSGQEGLKAALHRIHFGELPPPKTREDKPTRWNLQGFTF